MSIKIIHCADFHIGASFSHLNTKTAKMRADEVRASLKKAADCCIEKNVDALVISGDLFDKPNPTKADREFVKNILASLSPIGVYIIAGNHDYMCPESPFSEEGYFTENVHIFPCFEKSFDITEKNTVIWGKSYSANSTEQSFGKIIFDENKINILLLHGDIVSGSDYNIISKETLSSLPCNYAAFGHIHAGEIFSVGNVRCAYSGIPEGQSFGDCGTTGIIYAEISENSAQITPIDISQRKYCHIVIDITGKTEAEILAEALSSVKPDDLFKINLTGECLEDHSPDLEYIKTELEKSVFYVELTDTSVPSYDLDAIENEESLRGAFLRELRKKAQSEEEFIIAAKVGLDALNGRVPDLGGIL